MKTFKYIFPAVIIMMTSCQTERMELIGFNSDSDAVHVQVAVGEMNTRSNPVGDETKFNIGDQIAVNTEDQDVVIYTFDGTRWTPEPGKYLKWNKEQHEFHAYYPARYTGVEDIPTDQSDADKIAAADYMLYVQTVTKPADATLKMEMQRQTVRLVIDESQFVWMNQFKDDNGVVTHEVKSILVHSDGNNGVLYITPYKSGGKYYALVNPCAGLSDAPFITVTVGPKDSADDTQNDVLVIRGIPALKVGNSYNCKLTLGKDKAFVSDVSVVGWGTSTTLWEGQALNGFIIYTNGFGDMNYDIYTPEGLVEANQLIASGGDYANNVVINLYTDVTLTAPTDGGSNWTPIPVREFNGNGHTIKGLIINNPTADYQALISSGGTDGISNLTLEGCKVKGLNRVAGLIADGSGTITNCHVKATAEYPIEIEADGSNAGGLAAYTINCEIKNCSLTCATGVSVSIKMTGFDGYGIGGLVGYSTANSTISNCNVINNGGTITLSSSFNEVGGLAGANFGSISGCTVDGVTMSGARYIGGFVGVNNSSGKIIGTNTVKNCTVTGWKDSTSATVGSDNGKNTSITDGGGNKVTLQ